ncbi:DNA adenine methylase [Methylobacterium marchantiae]|uniref:site-specific DNA-methyltransferase (adenine-specific) n=1 Tax=Methylobacterium marchantiae TaxID=600331 RepID=A0ABW3X0L9_9HYPH|nr:Modification methylase DpnIIA [Methylobacterium marchantiae]
MSEPSLLRWAGSKRKSLPHLFRYWRGSERTHYLEPFCGSAALFFASEAEAATLCDKNEWLINFYRVVAEDPIAVYELSNSIPRCKDTYMFIRATAKANRTIESAAHFVYLNRNCFNGIYRTNKSGRFNVPFSAARTGEHPSGRTFLLAASKLRDAQLLSGDFEELVQNNSTASSFVYLDPPFATKNARVFTQYDSHSFGTSDINRLSRLLDYLDEINARFLVSYADVPEIYSLRNKWQWESIQVQRHISGFTAHRRNASEVLISNFEPGQAQ